MLRREFVIAWRCLLLIGGCLWGDCLRAEGNDPVEAIEAALASRETLDFTEVPIAEVCSELAKRYGINVFIDHKGLQQFTLTAEQPVTIKAEGITLESALWLALPQAGLGHAVQHQSLVITAEELAATIQEAKVYPVGDLFQESIDGFHANDLLILVELLIGMVEPETWDEVGGPGHLDVLSHTRSIVCTHHRLAQWKVRQALDEMRKARTEPIAASTDPDRLVLRVYQMRGHIGGGDSPPPPELIHEETDRLRLAIQATVEPESWTEAGGRGAMAVSGSSLFVRQTPAVHELIQAALRVHGPRFFR